MGSQQQQVASGESARGSHRLSSASQCPTKYKLRYIDGIREASDSPWRMGGTLHHNAIAHRYAERLMEQGGEAPDWWRGESIDEHLDRTGKGWPKLVTLAREMYDAYPAYWWQHNSKFEPWDIISVEKEYYARVADIDPDYEGCSDPAGPMGEAIDNEIISCGTDLLVRNRDSGLLYIVDHKSKAPFDPYAKRQGLTSWERDSEQYVLSWQGIINLHIIRHNFPDEIIGGFMVNRFTRSPPWEFDRHPVSIPQNAMGASRMTIRHAVSKELALEAACREGRDVPQYFWSCHGKFGLCDYAPLCSAPSSEERSERLSRLYVIR